MKRYYTNGKTRTGFKVEPIAHAINLIDVKLRMAADGTRVPELEVMFYLPGWYPVGTAREFAAAVLKACDEAEEELVAPMTEGAATPRR